MMLLVGCGSSSRRGDARVVSYRAFIGRSGDRQHLLTLPRIALAQPSVQTFRVRDLPAARYRYYLVLPIPRRVADAAADREQLQHLSWSVAVVSLAVYRPDGSLLVAKDYPLGPSSRRGGPIHGKWEMSLPELQGLEHFRSFDLRIEMKSPSISSRDWVQLLGRGYGNDRDEAAAGRTG